MRGAPSAVQIVVVDVPCVHIPGLHVRALYPDIASMRSHVDDLRRTAGKQ